MGKYLNPGNAGFAAVRKKDYLDKTGLISYINSTLGTSRKLTCVSRARRFGKSFAAQMLCAYYDKSCDSRELFEGLEISESPSFQTGLNRYDVLYLDIIWFIGIAENKKDILKNMQRELLADLREAYPEYVGTGEKSLQMALLNISMKTGNKFIFIIDEWDALFREAKEELALQKEYVQLLRGLFRSGLTDRMIEAVYMTGILPIKKYGTQSALSDFQEFTMISPMPLERYFGFTEEEVFGLCEKYNWNFEEMRRWYDGYRMGENIHMFNPKSVLDAIARKQFDSYWTQTETYESLRAYIGMNFDGLKDAIVSMLGGSECRIETETFQNDMTTFKSRDDVLTLLAHLGYLAYDSATKSVYIPNQEIREEFVRTVRNGDSPELVRLIQDSDRLMEATLHMDGNEVARLIGQIHDRNCAPQFYNNEQALRAVIQLAYISRVRDYLEFQEFPGGRGYADILFMPKRGNDKPLLLVELKWNKSAEGAIAQIKEKGYMEEVKHYGSGLLLVGINYNERTKKHTCVIEKMR